MKKTLILLLTFSILWASLLACAVQPLTIDQAFSFSATAKDIQTIVLQWQIAPGYYLYRDHFDIHTINPHDTMLAKPILPNNYTTKIIPTLGQFAVYKHNITIIQPIIRSSESTVSLFVHYQGCSEQGFCYPPVSRIVTMSLTDNKAITIPSNPLLSVTTTPKNALEQLLSSHMLIKMIATFFALGVLISLTPCVLPMLPILSSIIVGQKNPSRGYSFVLSLSYVLGMALTYAIAGIISVLVGINLQTSFQQPWLIIVVALIFVAMALSLFDVYQLQLPLSWRTHLARASDHQKHGSLIGTFFVGVFSTLILSPCVTPALVAALTYISQTKQLMSGGLALFCMGLGQGLPLLLIGIFGTHCLPKAGKWMTVIKKCMGIIMLVLAAWMISRLLPTTVMHRNTQQLSFITVKNPEELYHQLNTPAARNKPVLLDFYANWCVACKEMDMFTFSNLQVQTALKNVIKLRADVTHNDADDQALEHQFGVVAPPTVLFFDSNHHEIHNARIVGNASPNVFLNYLRQVMQ